MDRAVGDEHAKAPIGRPGDPFDRGVDSRYGRRWNGNHAPVDSHKIGRLLTAVGVAVLVGDVVGCYGSPPRRRSGASIAAGRASKVRQQNGRGRSWIAALIVDRYDVTRSRRARFPVASSTWGSADRSSSALLRAARNVESRTAPGSTDLYAANQADASDHRQMG